MANFFISFLMILSIMSNMCCNPKMEKDTMMVNNRIAEIASKEARRLGYEINKMNVEVESVIHDVEKFTEKHPMYKKNKLFKEKMGSQKFWAVYFSPKQTDDILFGGDLWVFIDSTNGEIITTIRGK